MGSVWWVIRVIGGPRKGSVLDGLHFENPFESDVNGVFMPACCLHKCLGAPPKIWQLDVDDAQMI